MYGDKDQKYNASPEGKARRRRYRQRKRNERDQRKAQSQFPVEPPRIGEYPKAAFDENGVYEGKWIAPGIFRRRENAGIDWRI